MRTEWQGIATLFESLERREQASMDLEEMGMFIKGHPRKTIRDILEELSSFHRYIRHLVQDRLRELGGLGGIAIETKKNQKEESYIHEGLAAKTDSERNEIAPEDEIFLGPRDLGHSALHIVLRENTMAQKKRLQNSDVSVTARNHLTFDETTRQLHQDPGVLISNKLKAEKIQELNNILHSFTFTGGHNVAPDSLQALSSLKETAYDFIFTILQFMYKFEMINKDHLRSFFETHETQRLLGEHLLHLLNVYSKDSLIPDMSLITRHWRTQHLHMILMELDENQIQFLTLTMLTGTSNKFIYLGSLRFGVEPTVEKLLSSEELLSRLEKLELIDQTKPQNLNHHLELINRLKSIIEYFQNPIPTKSTPKGENPQRIDYLIAFWVLKFIIDHHPKVIENCFSSSQDHEVFKSQFDLIKAGLTLHQQINQVLDDILSFDGLYSSQFSESVAKRTESIKLEIKNNLIKDFDEIKEKVLKSSAKNSKVKQWIHEKSISGRIIKFLTQRASLVKTDPESISSIDKYQYKNGFTI